MNRPIAAVCLIAGIVAGCSEGADTYTLALVPKAMNNPFFDQARDGCMRAAAELVDVECLYIGPGEHSEQEQVQILQDLISRRVDGIAVAPSNAPAIALALERARAAGIAVLTWDSDLLESDRGLRSAYIGTDNRNIGVEQARLLQRFKPDGGDLCIQSGGPAAANHNERMQGLRDTLSGRRSASPPGDRLAGEGQWQEVQGCPLYSNDDFPLAVQQMADILTRYPQLDAFVATGGFPQFVPQAYRQVVERHGERIAAKQTVLIVADTLPMQMEILRDGLSHGQVGQRPHEMGYRSMYVLRQLILGEEIDDLIFTGLDVCVAQNTDSCLQSEG
jgi:ribose transport system substrate-binding protein